ncbi:MAG TPA: calcium-binding protein [Actinomycetota bacterium]|nr:calcium-binding protein [Actinomycetota bacterium]
MAKRVGVVMGLIGLQAIAGAVPAGAAATCSYDAGTQTVTVTVTSGRATLLVAIDGTIKWDDDGTGAGAEQCGSANTGNTTDVVVNGDAQGETFVLNNRFGLPFPSSISWDIGLAGGVGDDLRIIGSESDDDNIAVTGSTLSMNGATGSLAGIENFILIGDVGNDTLDASGLPVSMRAVLEGGAGADTLKGGARRDKLDGGDGSDTLEGGKGKDQLAPGVDGSDDTVTGGEGSDTLALGAATADVTVDLAVTGPQPTGLGTDTIVGVENVVAGSGNDTLKGDLANNTLTGGPGTDQLRGGAGSDNFRGGAGDDLARGGGGDDVLRVAGGNDVARGGPGNDVLRMGPGDDTSRAGGGDDTIRAGRGNDLLNGGPGFDTCVDGPGRDTVRGCEA